MAAQRLAGARVPDRFEAQPLAFFQRVAQGYADRAAAAPQRFARIDADRPKEDVWRDVLGACQRAGYLPLEAS